MHLGLDSGAGSRGLALRQVSDKSRTKVAERGPNQIHVESHYTNRTTLSVAVRGYDPRLAELGMVRLPFADVSPDGLSNHGKRSTVNLALVSRAWALCILDEKLHANIHAI